MLSGSLAFAGAMLLGVVLLRLKGHYFAVASLAVAEVLRELANTSTDLTGGGMGLNIPLSLGGGAGPESEASFFFLAMWALLMVTLACVLWIERSKLGFGLQCILHKPGVCIFRCVCRHGGHAVCGMGALHRTG
jgi:branched-chain amino acid transport system permease protein